MLNLFDVKQLNHHTSLAGGVLEAECSAVLLAAILADVIAPHAPDVQYRAAVLRPPAYLGLTDPKIGEPQMADVTGPEGSEVEIVAKVDGQVTEGQIQRLASGYDTRLEESGANLSQGQRQLLSITRAILADPAKAAAAQATAASTRGRPRASSDRPCSAWASP